MFILISYHINSIFHARTFSLTLFVSCSLDSGYVCVCVTSDTGKDILKNIHDYVMLFIKLG